MPLKNKVILFLGNTRFDSPIKATSLFIARNLAKHNQVYFIDYPFTWKDYFGKHNNDKLKNRRKKFSYFSDGLLDTDLPNFKIVITPPVIPINFLPEGSFFRMMLGINEAIISTRLKRILKRNGVKDFIYINSFNFHYPGIASLIRPTLQVYHCVDPMIVPYDRKHGVVSEEYLVNESDLVICTSKALFIEKGKVNKDTYFVPNATDSNHLLSESIEIHGQLKELKRPIIGYLGTVERRIDYELVKEVAEANPDKSFVFAGPVNEDYVPDFIFNIPNIHLLGGIRYEEVLQVIKSFDIAMIPFKNDEVSNTIFPIKLFEYLSAGKPVIATDFNLDLKEHTGEVVSYCTDEASFTKAIDECFLHDNPAKIEERRALAKENTWEKRSDQIAAIISGHLQIAK